MPPQSLLQSWVQASAPVLPPTQSPQLSVVAEPPQSPLQSWVQSFEPSLSHVPQLSSVASPAQSPLQSTAAVQLPSQSKFSAAYVQEPSSEVASELWLHAVSSVQPGTSTGPPEPGVYVYPTEFAASPDILSVKNVYVEPSPGSEPTSAADKPSV